MDYEKKYNESLDRARKFMNEHPTRAEADLIVALFPELAESEDEKIRKELISLVRMYVSSKDTCLVLGGSVTRAQAESWLEKQKEPHYTKRNALFDKCVENCDPATMKRVSDEVDAMLEKEQKPVAWSEEDETAFGDLMWCIEQARKSAKDENDMGNIWFAENWLKNRLKDIRPQPHWKPSEVQMRALKYVAYHLMPDENYREEMFSLYEQLKKL